MHNKWLKVERDKNFSFFCDLQFNSITIYNARRGYSWVLKKVENLWGLGGVCSKPRWESSYRSPYLLVDGEGACCPLSKNPLPLGLRLRFQPFGSHSTASSPPQCLGVWIKHWHSLNFRAFANLHLSWACRHSISAKPHINSVNSFFIYPLVRSWREPFTSLIYCQK